MLLHGVNEICANKTALTEETLNHVFDRWPDLRFRGRRLVATDERLREVCDDYELLATWIDTQRGNPTADDLANAKQLLEMLAAEITDLLERHDSPRADARFPNSD